MAAGDVLLQVRDISQSLQGNLILKGVSFQVTDLVRPGTTTGQIVGLLGPSGVGKTRLLRIIAGLDAPQAGEVLGPGGGRFTPGSVGVVFQSYPLLRHRTVLGNLIVAGIANGLPGAEAREQAMKLLQRFDLTDRATYYPAQLSGGQRQRVAIAQQLVRQKHLLLMDEPFSGLDPASLGDVTRLLVEVANMDELNTLIIVTHDIRAAMVVSDTLLMLGRDRGADGAPQPGARVQELFDLVALGLAWRSDVESDPRFVELEKTLKERFKTL